MFYFHTFTVSAFSSLCDTQATVGFINCDPCQKTLAQSYRAQVSLERVNLAVYLSTSDCKRWRLFISVLFSSHPGRAASDQFKPKLVIRSYCLHLN